MQLTDEKVIKRGRRFYPESLDITDPETVKKCYEELLSYRIDSSSDLIRFAENVSELQMLISQEEGQRYVKMTCKTNDDDLKKRYQDYYNSVVIPSKRYNNLLDKKFYDSSGQYHLPENEYRHLQNIIANRIEIFREENVPLAAKEMELSNRYSAIISQMTAEYEGKEQTLAQLSKYLQSNEREVRKQVWQLRMERLGQDRETLNEIFDELRHIREKQAENASFTNYRDYKHQEMGRFSYTPEDVLQFHSSVEKTVLHFLKEITEERREKLCLKSVKPYDTAVDLDGKILTPFTGIDDFIDKGIKILYKVAPKYGINFNKMKNSSLLDLDNRKGKSPGGYNYPLRELGSSFIMMNAVGVQRDVVTLLHEAGHAMHSFATKPLHLMDYKECPHESAELASMAMEMLTMDYWDELYPSEEELKKAKKDQLVKTLQFLPWCMTVDAFQQWIYTNPQHTPQERDKYFAGLIDRFSTGTDWSGLEGYKEYSWMLQLHLFKYPFYYIEYGIAQLAALAIYRNYRQNKEKAIKEYDNFLVQGYTKPLNELYETAGIRFDFSEQYISGLVDFVGKEMEQL